MPTIGSRLAAVAVVTAGLVALAPGAPAVAAAGPNLFLVAMPRAEAEAVFSSRTAGVGLGVYPESRDPLAFIREIGSGAPRGRDGRAELGGEAGRLGGALADAGLDVLIEDGGPPDLRRTLALALQLPPRVGTGAARDGRVVGVALSTAAELERVLADETPSATVVIGVSDRTPVIVGLIGVPLLDRPESRGGWILTDGITRRPAIVTPYDVTATILHSTGVAEVRFGPRSSRKTVPVPSSRFIGRDLTVEPPARGTALEDIHRIEARLVRDARSSAGLAVTAVVMAIVVVVLAAVLLLAGRRDLAVRAAQGSWFVAATYPAAQFVPTGRTEVRASVIAALLMIGVTIPIRGAPRVFARVALAATGAFVLLMVVAPLRPGGEPALSLWGNPLISWRFFGLQNGQAAAIAGGVVVWGLLAGLRPRLFALTALGAAFVIGTPKVGANFVGVLTFVFGAVLAYFALVRRRIEVWHLVVSAALGAAGFVLALVSDAASPLSHGGRAARRISESGLSAGWRFVRARLELNIDLIRDMFAGVLLVGMLVAAITALLVWSIRTAQAPRRARAAVWAGAAMALASLVLEDSGFYSGGIIALAAATAWIIATGSGVEEETPAVSSPASPSGGAG